jgi:hypothetical protein
MESKSTDRTDVDVPLSNNHRVPRRILVILLEGLCDSNTSCEYVFIGFGCNMENEWVFAYSLSSVFGKSHSSSKSIRRVLH